MHSRSNNESTPRNGKPELVVFADDWGRHPSSCQHLVSRLRDRYKVLWVNTIGTRKLRFNWFTVRRGWEKLRTWKKGTTPVNEQMNVIDVPMLPWIGSSLSRSGSRWLVTRNLRKQMGKLGFHRPILMTTLPHVSWLVGDIGQAATIYYCTDDYSQWPHADRDALLFSERLLLQKADLALAVSQHLVSRCGDARRCEYFPHAVDYEHFQSVAQTPAHPQILDLPGPRIGFFGLVYEKINFPLLAKLAEEFPQGSIVLIGPVDYCPDDFANLPNVHILGKRPYEDLPRWLAGLDVLLMPYVMDEMIRQSNPLKLRECLATGKPTVCVDIPEARRFEPHVRVAANDGEFIEAVRSSLGEDDRAVRRQKAVESETWESRAGELSEHLENLSRSSGIAN